MRNPSYVLLAGMFCLGTPAAWAQDAGCAPGACPPVRSAAPAIRDRSVYVSQIGTGNVATIDQAAPIAFARIEQKGDENRAEVRQNGPSLAYADLSQLGIGNSALIAQDGVTGGNTLRLQQSGTGNGAQVMQTAGGVAENVAALVQSGNGNNLSLVQDGDDNQATLTQMGDGNTLTASQLGSGNRLEWTQQGNNLSALAIAQTGGQAIQVIQTK